MGKNIINFEDIISMNKDILKDCLLSISTADIVKASMGTSPDVNALLKEMLQNIDFEKERCAIGSVKIEEIEAIHAKVVSTINAKLY